MALFSGKCKGGPYDGRPLHHGVPTLQIVLNNGKPLTYRASEALIATAGTALTHGTYTHQKDGWVWSEP